MSKEYKSNPNQRKLTINRTMPQKGINEPFLQVYTKNIQAASKNLNGIAFKIFVYLLCNADKYELWYSPATISEACGISVDGARNGFKELLEKGYIAQIGKSKYSFYETPHLQIDLSSFVEERRIVRYMGGGEGYLTYSEVKELLKDKKTEKQIEEYWYSLPIVEEEN